MTVSTLMTGKSPSTSFAGVANNDDFVLAVYTGTISGNTTPSVGDYTVVQGGITAVESALNPETKESNYIRQGKVTNKTGNQRTFNVTGDRMHGDAFQDWALAAAVAYGTGSGIVVPYVWFSVLTGQGEQGSVAVIVNSDGSGEAGATAEIDIDLMATGTPTAYTYSSGSGGSGSGGEG